MYETTRTTQALALAILLAPAISHAADSAPSTITQSNPGIGAAASAKAALPTSLAAIKDDYKDLPGKDYSIDPDGGTLAHFFWDLDGDGHCEEDTAAVPTASAVHDNSLV